MDIFPNPFRPGAGQIPPWLAGRQDEQNEFLKTLNETPIIRNLIITGLRGVGKTVLLETLKPIAINQRWFWAGTDLSESASVSEQSLAIRIITDISGLIAAFPIGEKEKVGFGKQKESIIGGYEYLLQVYGSTPGLASDKLKAVLETVWNLVKGKTKGIVLAYDEAQILKDQADDKQYPLSLLLEVVQYLQRKQIPYLLVLTGLPTLFPNLVETRTYAERMFHVMNLEKLEGEDVREAIVKPMEKSKTPVRFTDFAIGQIIKFSGGYPYFIQFICKEFFDSFIQQIKAGFKEPVVTIPEIVRKLDTDFYSGRWARLTDRQRDLMRIISLLDTAEDEFSVQDITEMAKEMHDNSFSASNANQMLIKLGEAGLIYKNRHGKYSFAVPMLSEYIKRQTQSSKQFKTLFDGDDF